MEYSSAVLLKFERASSLSQPFHLKKEDKWKKLRQEMKTKKMFFFFLGGGTAQQSLQAWYLILKGIHQVRRLQWRVISGAYLVSGFYIDTATLELVRVDMLSREHSYSEVNSKKKNWVLPLQRFSGTGRLSRKTALKSG